VHSVAGEAVLKLAPDVARAHRETSAQRRFGDAHVAPPVLMQGTIDTPAGALAVTVTELVGDGKNLRQTLPVTATIDQIADLVATIERCGQTPLPIPLPRVTDHLSSRIDRPTARLRPSDVRAARRMLDDLGGHTDGRWVHGSLHPGNIVILGQRLASVDCNPMLGDWAYDVAEVSLKWGHGTTSHPADVDAALAQATLLCRMVGADFDRVAAWMQLLIWSGA
jgi:streptomycin 6-kinase